MKFHFTTAVVAAAIIAGSALGADSQAGEPVPSVPGAQSALPLPAQEFLTRMQAAMAQGQLLEQGFYDVASLQQLFGPGYRFTAVPAPDGEKLIYFDTGGNVYFDGQGAPTALGLHRPCLLRGTISFKRAGAGRQARSGIAIHSAGRDPGAGGFDADLVLQVLGKPSATSAGWPSVPPPHGLPYQPTPQVHPMGNLWLTYQTEANGFLQSMRFLTSGDATIMEIQILEEQR